MATDDHQECPAGPVVSGAGLMAGHWSLPELSSTQEIIHHWTLILG